MLIKEWEWDYHTLSFHSDWHYNEDYFKFFLFEVEFSDNHIAIGFLNFAISYGWD